MPHHQYPQEAFPWCRCLGPRNERHRRSSIDTLIGGSGKACPCGVMWVEYRVVILDTLGGISQREARRMVCLHPGGRNLAGWHVFHVRLVFVFQTFDIDMHLGSWISFGISLYRPGSIAIIHGAQVCVQPHHINPFGSIVRLCPRLDPSLPLPGCLRIVPEYRGSRSSVSSMEFGVLSAP